MTQSKTGRPIWKAWINGSGIGMRLQQVYAGTDGTLASGAPCGDFLDARTNALNLGLPLGLLTIDEAIDMMDAQLCK